jgi:TIR domain
MTESAHRGDKLNVFISYSRDDLGFAEQLRAALVGYGFGVTIDREDILGGDAWRRRISGLIRDADTVVFVLSPSSARAPMCAWEVTESITLGKRIIPIVCCPIEDATPPPELTELNYIYFYSEPKFPGSGFGTGLVKLTTALDTNPDWLREHTRYLRLAKEWEEVGKPSDRRLLSAPDIALAKDWVASRPIKTPEPTSMQLDFIKASETEDKRQRSAEARRLQELAEAERRAKEAAEKAAGEAKARATAEAEARASAEQKAIAERQARDAADEAARQAQALAATEADLRTIADQKAEVEQKARRYAEMAAGNLRRYARNLRTALFAVVATAAVAVVGFGIALWQTKETRHQLDRANQALAESIDNDLGLEPNEPLGPRQRQALWKLALADEPVKSDFVSILANSSEETVRVSRGFAQISRALGLLRPSPAEAEKLVAPAVGGLKHTRGQPGFLIDELKALKPKLTGAQASQALDPLLKQMGQTTNPYALVALTQPLPTLPWKLTEAQAGQALDPLLQQIAQTTDPYTLRAMRESR